jgi:hypothetical protein
MNDRNKKSIKQMLSQMIQHLFQTILNINYVQIRN